MIIKLIWVFRRIIYALFYRNISFSGYLGRPIIIVRPNKLYLEERSRIFPGNRFEIHSKDGRIVVGKGCSIGHNFHCTAVGKLIIGKNTLITPNVCVTDIDHDYSLVGKPVIEQSFLHKETRIGSNCFIGYGSVIQAGTILGDQCIVGANSVVRGVFPSLCVIAGSPAKIIKKYNTRNNMWEKVK